MHQEQVIKRRVWHGVEYLYGAWGVESPGCQARNRFHAFLYPNLKDNAHARSTTYRSPYQRRTRPPGAYRGVARSQAALLAAERLSSFRVPMDEHRNSFKALRHNGL